LSLLPSQALPSVTEWSAAAAEGSAVAAEGFVVAVESEPAFADFPLPVSQLSHDAAAPSG